MSSMRTGCLGVLRFAAYLGVLVLGHRAEAQPHQGSVRSATSRWVTPDLIATDLEIVDASGRRRTTTVLGGTVDGIGMELSHHPLPRAHDQITYELEGDHVRIRAIAPRPLLAVSPARFGIKRTAAGTPVWRSRCLAFVYDATPLADLPDAYELLDRAFAAWATGTCAPLAVSPSVGDARSALDGIDSIVFRQDRWCRPSPEGGEVCYSPEAAATTRTVYVNRPGEPDDGRIIETDIEINAVDFAFFHDNQSREQIGEPADFLSVVTHEIGHAIGLAHNCATQDETAALDLSGVAVPNCQDVADDPAYTLATMYPAIARGEQHKRSLSDSDAEAACAVLRSGTCEAAHTAGCQVGGGQPWVVVILILGGLVVRGRRRFAWLLAASGCVGVPPADAPASGRDVAATMTGLTTDYFTGVPVAGVVVVTRGFAPDLRALSDRDGTYTFDGLPTDSMFVLATEADERFHATSSPHSVDSDEVFAEAAMVSRADVKRQAATLGVALEDEAGVVFAEITRGGAPAIGLSLADITLVDPATGTPVEVARAAWFGSLGDVDPRIVTSFPTGRPVRLALVGVAPGTYVLEVASTDEVASVAVEVLPAGATVASIDLAAPAETGADFATVYAILQRSEDGGDGCAGCHTERGSASLLVMDDGVEQVRTRLNNHEGAVNRADPLSSFLLARPLYEVPADHPNAAWLSIADPSAQSVLAWIEAGAP